MPTRSWHFSCEGKKAHLWRSECGNWWRGWVTLCGTAYENSESFKYCNPYNGWQRRCKTCSKISKSKEGKK